MLKKRQNILDHESRSIEGGINYARQAFTILNNDPELPGRFIVERPGKDYITLVHRKGGFRKR